MEDNKRRGKTILDTRNGFLIKNDKKVELSPLEYKFLGAIANNELVTYSNISRFMYGYSDKDSARATQFLKHNLCRKIKLDILTMAGVGYKLQEDIFIK